MSLRPIVQALGGDLYDRGQRANIPAPGHSAADRSVSLLLKEGRIIVHTFGDGDWRAVLDRASTDRASPHRLPRAFPVEAHAQLVSEAYARRHGFSPAPALGRRDGQARAMEEALTGLRAGRAPTLRGRAV